MDIDTDKIDAAILALLQLTLHDGNRAWKNYDWDTLSRLHAKGLIANPINRAQSLALTETGLAESQRLFADLFTRSPL